MLSDLEFASIGPIIKKFLDELDKTFPDKIPASVYKDGVTADVILRDVYRVKGQREVITALSNNLSKLQRR